MRVTVYTYTGETALRKFTPTRSYLLNQSKTRVYISLFDYLSETSVKNPHLVLSDYRTGTLVNAKHYHGPNEYITAIIIGLNRDAFV